MRDQKIVAFALNVRLRCAEWKNKQVSVVAFALNACLRCVERRNKHLFVFGWDGLWRTVIDLVKLLRVKPTLRRIDFF